MTNSRNKNLFPLREIPGALAGAFFLSFLLQKILELGSLVHWVVGAILAGAALVGVFFMGAWIRRLGGLTPIGFVVVALTFSTASLAAIGGWTSFTLYHFELAEYTLHGEDNIDMFVRQYLYTFIDLLPGLDVWETLKVNPPVEPDNAWAGAPLVFFRLFVIGWIIDTFKVWRQKSTESKRIDSGSETIDENTR